jgi:hypothetical protein
MYDRFKDGGKEGEPELRDRPFCKIAENQKISQSVSTKIVHFA